MIDNATSRDFVSLLPLKLKLEDYGETEKIGYLPRKLSAEGAPSGSDPSVGDVSYYAPWGNLAIFRRDFHYSKHLGGVTYGGYSDSIVADERFVLRVPSNLDLAGAAPLLCAGITTYSPLRHWGVTKGQKVGVAGLGGLGHMGVKFAHALGAHVVVFTTSPGKKADALRLGADEVAVSRDADEMKKHAGSFDYILDTVSADHDINAYLNLLRRDGNITLVGAPEKPLAVSAFSLLMGSRSLSGSPIGGIAETQEMLDFCGTKADIRQRIALCQERSSGLAAPVRSAAGGQARPHEDRCLGFSPCSVA